MSTFPEDDLLRTSRVIDTEKNDSPFRTSTLAGLRDRNGKLVPFRPTDSPMIAEMNRRAQENRPKSDGKAQEVAHALQERNKNDFRIRNAINLVTDEMLDVKARSRNPMHVVEFCRRLDKILGKEHGLSRIYLNKPPDHPQFRNQMGLFIRVRGQERRQFHDDLPVGWKKFTTVQVPYMAEWGVPRRDPYGALIGWIRLGWRGNVLLNLIKQGAITEAEAVAEFGEPSSVSSESYRKQLFDIRPKKQVV